MSSEQDRKTPPTEEPSYSQSIDVEFLPIDDSSTDLDKAIRTTSSLLANVALLPNDSEDKFNRGLQLVDSMKELLERREAEREAEFRRNLTLLEKRTELELKIKEQEAEQSIAVRSQSLQERRVEEKQNTERIEAYFKMGLSLLAFGAGVFFVWQGRDDIGSFLLGGGLSTLTSNAAGLLRAARSKS